MNKLLNIYSPFAIHFNFLDQETRDTAMLINSPDYEDIIINGQQIDYSYIIKEQLNMQDTTINLLFDIHRTTPNQCNHDGCAYYPLQLCKKWNSIPKRHEDCRFPHWFPMHFSYKINPKERRLERITDTELQEHQEEYIRLQKTFGPSRFSYIFNGNRCRLNIKRKTIEEKDLEYIPAFIEEQLKEKDVPSLAGFLTFHFPGYEEDTREVFEIPDIREYIDQTFRVSPSLIYYLDLSEAETRAYVLPFFVQYENLTADDRSYTLRFELRSFDNFISETSNILIRFAKEQRLNAHKVLKTFFNQLK